MQDNVEFICYEDKSYPISKPEDISAAIENFNKFGAIIGRNEFLNRLYKLVLKRDYVRYLPTKVKKNLGLYRENGAERPESDYKNKKYNKPKRQQRYYEDE